jgi:hypothetical protein
MNEFENSHECKRDKFLFIHIGKTAGTSLRSTISNSFGADACSPPFAQRWFSEVDFKYFDQFPFICGHISAVDCDTWFKDRTKITTLREPIDRCLSFLHYVKALPPHSSQIAADAHGMNMLDLIETNEGLINLNNTMVRQLGGHILDRSSNLDVLLERAKRTLRDCAWVGRHDRIGQSIASLERELGVSLQMQRDNVTENRPARAVERPEVISRLNALNQYDFELWRWYCEVFWDEAIEHRRRA